MGYTSQLIIPGSRLIANSCYFNRHQESTRAGRIRSTCSREQETLEIARGEIEVGRYWRRGRIKIAKVVEITLRQI